MRRETGSAGIRRVVLSLANMTRQKSEGFLASRDAALEAVARRYI
jgi:hypothetical protein